MADQLLTLSLHGVEIGVMTTRRGLATFEFLDSYIDQAKRPVLGQKFEEDLRGRWRQQGRSPVWFSNLLPEDGLLRDFLASHLAIKPTAELDLLVALGRDLPGAVTIEVAEETSSGGKRFEREVADPEQKEPEGRVRFSAAGIQLKLSMIRERNSIRLPGAGELGGHFVKFAGTLERVPNNEFAMMSLASSVGLNTPPVELLPVESLSGLPSAIDRLKGTQAYIIERFDRTPSGERVHIEDLNQVLGQWPEKKYEGASYDGIGNLIKAMCGTEDFWEFFDRLLFSILVGNEDAHLKNWSIYYPDTRSPRLAPLYDVVSTVVIPGLDRGIALSFAGERRPQAIDRAALSRFAGRAGVDAAELDDRAFDLVQRVKDAEPAIRGDDRGLTSHEWAVLDDYRSSVPIIADFSPQS